MLDKCRIGVYNESIKNKTGHTRETEGILK